MTRVVVSLMEDERKALVQLALSELRDPRAQATFIIRKYLQEAGLIQDKGWDSDEQPMGQVKRERLPA